MSITKTPITAPPIPDDAPVVPAPVLSDLAARARAAGVCLLLARPDGTLAFADADPAANPFFTRYLLPTFGTLSWRMTQLASPEINPAPAPEVWTDLPGVTLAACPLAGRRQVELVLLLAAKSDTFATTHEDFLRACSRHHLDATYFTPHANDLPSYAPHALAAQASLFASLLRERTRVTDLEKELDTLSGQLADTYEELSLIYQISSGMKVNRQADDFFRQTCADVLNVMNLRAVGVSLDPAHITSQPPVFFGDLTLSSDDSARLATSVLDLVRERRAPVLLNTLADEPRLAWLAPRGRRVLAVPFQRQDQVLGCLIAIDKQDDDDFNSVDSKLLNSIANECAIYLENATLFEDVHGLMMGLLHSLTAAVDAKDAYTCGHSQRVALLSRALATQLGLTPYEVERVYMAGLLHDVGKIGVPEAVLQKAGKLTDEEFDLIKKHPEIGARILGDIKQLRDALPGVLHHHERYDGRGYPARLAGQDIPLLGRIICLADSFDAMTSSRTYRKAMPLEVALTEIRRAAGTQFDPSLAEAFLAIDIEDFRSILKNHQALSRQLTQDQTPRRRATAA